MDESEILRRIGLGEDSSTELKSVLMNGFAVDPDRLAETIAAFANSGGGDVFIGVEDDGTVTGVGDAAQSDRLMRQVSQIGHDKVRPVVVCRMKWELVAGQKILVLRVPGYAPGRPFRAGNVNWIRDANRNRVAESDELRRLLESYDFHFDTAPVADASFSDLEPGALAEFRDRVTASALPPETSAEGFARIMDFVDDSNRPTVSGILLCGRAPQRWFAHARVTAARIPGVQFAGAAADQAELEGRLPSQFDAAVEFVKRHLAQPTRIEGLERVEAGLPEEVVREAITNALVHRDYRSGSQVRLFIYDDRVEVWNPGGLLNSMTIEKMKVAGASQPRNPRLASLLRRFHRADVWGMGVPEMIRRMAARHLPEPIFEVGGGQFCVKLRTRA